MADLDVSHSELWSLDPGLLHLNHGSFGAVPVRAQEHAARLRAEMEANPPAWFRSMPDRLPPVRERIAGYLGVEVESMALVPNASAGMTVALASVDLPEGSTIVCTDQGYGAVRFAIERRARQTGAGIVTAGVPLDADDDAVLAAVAAAMDDRTAVVVVDQITSPTAMVFPLDRLTALCRDAGVPIVVDGAHAPGLIDDPCAARPDFWTGNLHKWPCAPRGSAALVVGERWRDRTFPLIVSFGDCQPYAERFDDQATVDYVPWLATPESLELLTEIDWPGIRSAWSERLDEIRDMVAAVPAVRAVPVVTPPPTQRLLELPAGFLTDFKAQRQRAVEKFGMELGFQVWNGRSFLRLSAHAYNRPRDFEILAERLPALLEQR